MSDERMTVEQAADQIHESVDDCAGTPEDCSYQAILGIVERLAAAARAEGVEEERKRHEESLIGRCGHGYGKCFYCWRDAGFLGTVGR